MYELDYVKKRRRKKGSLIIGSVGALGVAVLVIIAFLGRAVGTFTVALKNNEVKLALSDEHTFTNPTTFLRINEIESFEEFTYSKLREGDENFDLLDSDETDYLYGANYNEGSSSVTSMNFFKYTFYVRNVGNVIAQYELTLNIVKSEPSTDGTLRYLDDTIRVLMFENNVESDEHLKAVYAKRGSVAITDENGNRTYKEYVSVPLDPEINLTQPFEGFAEMFESDTRITTRKVNGLGIGDTIRYTVVTWLEGWDPQSNNQMKAPVGASIKLGVDIKASEY